MIKFYATSRSCFGCDIHSVLILPFIFKIFCEQFLYCHIILETYIYRQIVPLLVNIMKSSNLSTYYAFQFLIHYFNGLIQRKRFKCKVSTHFPMLFYIIFFGHFFLILISFNFVLYGIFWFNVSLSLMVNIFPLVFLPPAMLDS